MLRWEIPLEGPPEVEQIARNVHGFVASDTYCLPDLWSLHLYGYHARVVVGGQELPIRPGHLGLTPPGLTTEFHYVGLSPHLFVHFRLPAGPHVPIRAMQDLGADHDAVYRRLAEIIDAPASRQSARLWDLLWDLVDREGSASAERRHPAVRRAVAHIERHLADPISVSDLAERAGVSYGYLSRLFGEAFGTSVVGYLRRRRVERAVHLLQRSTLSIKFIAASVGFDDLQHFNKAVRAETGVSPRAHRQG